jgi:3-oxoacyl-[acyl-carrier protein] reductase
MDLGLKDKVALINGGSKGIGRAIAFGLAEEGCRVGICARGKEGLQATAREIEKKTGVSVLTVQAEVRAGGVTIKADDPAPGHTRPTASA